MNQPAIIVNRDNCSLHNISITNGGNPNTAAVVINGNNFTSDGVSIQNFAIGYFAENRSNLSITRNSFLLPNNKALPIVRATLFINCKSIKITNNTVIFESLVNFQKIKMARQLTINTTEYQKLMKLIKFKFPTYWTIKTSSLV